MTKTEILLLQYVLDTLTGQTASDEIKALLNDQNMRVWLDSWVRTPLHNVIASGKGEINAYELRYRHRL